MCGITGIMDTGGKREIDRGLLGRMNDSQTHRGPDEHGLYVAPGIGLGHRRLSIIDLSSGQQPLFNEDHSVVVTFNGEIFNFQSLTTELLAKGHKFRTHSDTEVIVHAWEEWGEDCVKRFRGQFAFAVWDSNSETLFLARDRLGQKPLHYTVLADRTLVFGSELKSVLTHPATPRVIEPQSVEDYFGYGYIPDPRTIFKGIYKLPPGHTLTIRRNAAVPAPKEYWDISFDKTLGLSEQEICEELITRLREAVKIRMIADVPLGAFLSGGVDSSAIVALMAQTSDAPVNTCSISFDVPQYDESKYALEVAQRYKTNHNTKLVDPNSFDLVDRLAGFFDEPFADSSAMPTFRVCELARERVTVALSGDVGDELFAGYRRYRWHHYEQSIRNRFPQALRGPLFTVLGRLYPKMDWAPKVLRARSTFQALAEDPFIGYFHSVSVLRDELRSRLFSDKMRGELQGYHAANSLIDAMNAAKTDDDLSRAQYADMKTYLPGDILTKVDRTSMAVSLEVRSPIIDHEFMEWAAGIPAAMRLKGREGKYIFKKALEPHLPHDVMYREKMGFAVPISEWFRGPLRQRVGESLASDVLADTGMFDMGYLRKLVEQHQSGVSEHSPALWALLMFESSLRKLFGEADAAPQRRATA